MSKFLSFSVYVIPKTAKAWNKSEGYCLTHSPSRNKNKVRKTSKTHTAGDASCILPLQEPCLLEGSFVSS